MTQHFIHLPTGLALEVEPDETGWFAASVPALPGCVAQGETPAEALQDLLAAMDDVLAVIQQDEPERYKQLTSPSLSEKRWGIIGDGSTPQPVVEQDSCSESARVSG